MLPRRLLSWIVALTLLFSQAAAFAHALSHLHAHDGALPDKVCEVCVAQAQLGAAMPPSPANLATPAAACILVPVLAAACAGIALFAACARAPPAPVLA